MASITDKLKGKAKRAEGRVTGDRVREAQGAIEEKKADIEGAFERTRDRARARMNEVKARRSAKRATSSSSHSRHR